MEDLILVRGGGDLSSGVIHTLSRCGYRILVLECENPSAVRRKVSFCEAVYEGKTCVEGVVSKKVDSVDECPSLWERGEIPVLCDPEGHSIGKLHPRVVIDAVMAKRNLGTTREMASLTIALGPGFTAGEDVDYVVETMRGHTLGRIISSGSALPDTGIPAVIGGRGKERVLRAPTDGNIRTLVRISDIVSKGDTLATVGEIPVRAPFSGVVRGLIREGYPVRAGMKIGDMDPRMDQARNCFTISDKSRCIAGSVLEILISSGVLP